MNCVGWSAHDYHCMRLQNHVAIFFAMDRVVWSPEQDLHDFVNRKCDTSLKCN